MDQGLARARQEQDDNHLCRDAQARASGLWCLEDRQAIRPAVGENSLTSNTVSKRARQTAFNTSRMRSLQNKQQLVQIFRLLCSYVATKHHPSYISQIDYYSQQSPEYGLIFWDREITNLLKVGLIILCKIIRRPIKMCDCY